MRRGGKSLHEFIVREAASTGGLKDECKPLTPSQSAALKKACSLGGVYHEFRNTSTIRALHRRGLIQSEGRVGWYVATDAGRLRLQPNGSE